MGLAALALLFSVPLRAQVEYGDLHANANGLLQVLYNGAYGNLEQNEHSVGFAGQGQINGDYYNPNFLSFSLMPYYDRSQANSDTASITDSSGYTGMFNIFRGSEFPGLVVFNQNWNSSGNYGIPGLLGPATANNNHAVNIAWSALLPGWPTFTVGFGDTGGNSSILGSSSSSESSTRNFSLGSTYAYGKYYFSGGFIHLNTSIDLNDSLLTGESETSNTSSNQYRLSAQGPFPYRSSSMSVGFNRTSYDTTDSVAGQYSGTTDTLNGNLNLQFPKVPVSVYALYTDNILGSVEQQLISNGQTPLVGLNSPDSHSISVGATTFVTVAPRLMVGGYVTRLEQFYDGQTIGTTQIGVSASYNFFKMLKGLTVYAGLFDVANQQGNTNLGFVGNVSYNRNLGKWDIDVYGRYNQSTQTLLGVYTLSTLNYGGTVKRQIKQDLRWAAVASLNRSVFEQTAGNGSHSESFTTMLMWKRASISGFYTKSEGNSILTASGLVTTPLPPSVLSPTNAVLYNGDNYGGSFTVLPIRGLQVSCAWSKSLSNTLSPTLFSNFGSTNAYGLLTYYYRKLLFQAGFTKFNQNTGSLNQNVGPSSLSPGMLTSYSFGISRWFKAF